ncbi:MAG: sigma-54-dependent Fis family transcriptional regulator, partial [FCB group bacterium]|nr:sigma-54-dependent Fis family transcriptional regulator [FCB group bacterium]
MKTKILLADDDQGLRKVISFKLNQQGYEVTSVEDGEQALKEIRINKYDLLLSDMRMPGMDGITLLEKAKEIYPQLEVILITAFADISQAVRAIKLGAFDYLTKPFDDEQLFVTIEKVLKFKKLEVENLYLKEQLKNRTELNHITGVSRPYKEMMGLIEKIAPTDANVLLTGESGVGKEVVARIIHNQSSRRDNDLIAVNCAAIPKELIESELFGHVKGAFTGAIKNKKGKFELADGGSLLLDEISELSVELQAKLLRVIQERTIEPVGSESKIEIDIRLMAATNKNLKERVASGDFRED